MKIYALTKDYFNLIDEKCDTLMVNLSPICANSTWDMFDLNGHKSKFFCCHPGFIGVKPKYYGPGLCLEADQKVSPTQLATPVSLLSDVVECCLGRVRVL